ncbi:osmotically inducible protein OsmC [Sphingobacterium shayense]|uniref:OsmC family protein n=1 Tax=Sphingobacterium shayense TaxID=626343 RepID=UPI001555D241|nr:OsmC family protein [Sphingobacterium shayense]NQD70757.1 osmotically inducible protein OsmC [Sphingobacterium shayense]
MAFKHTFTAQLEWLAERTSTTDRSYPKTHHISIQGKQSIEVSAAKAFKGNPSLYNPEDLLLSSLMSCHMMSYLYVCSQHDIEVLSYNDKAQAFLETHSDGSGKIVEVRLSPSVVISDPSKITLALSLHTQANKLCFIANSCNFDVHHEPTCASK